jgi:hypothetical protein
MQKYRKKDKQTVIAVQLDLDTEGLHYFKWGDQQFAKKGDWLVNNNGSTYTIDQAVFKRTYRRIGSGKYEKVSAIHAVEAHQDGSIETLEGRTHYLAGDYVVYEKPGQTKGAYAIARKEFQEMYRLVDSD